MPPKKKKDDDDEDIFNEEPPPIQPYLVLSIEKSADTHQIKQAYRKAALKHHPDKAPDHLKDDAHSKFQEIAFAYAVLSDPIRRKRYDVTGSTSESVDIDGFSWSEFYAEQFKDVITTEVIETFSQGYKSSDEEKDDLLNAYTKFKGKWSGIYGTVMLSNMLEDEERYRGIIDEAIAKGDVKAFSAYTNETEKSKEMRMKRARKEEKEAEEYAKELDVEDELPGKGKGKASRKQSGEDTLTALIQKKQAGRGAAFLDHLEAKYARENKKPKGKKRVSDDDDEDEDTGVPSEEAFQAAAARLKTGGKNENPRAKRAKR
ncbi:putative DnaJ like protein subfamily C member 9 [Amylocarpus encephaloides]|uniref:DnaJ like protein subfamily C member 9 n=1 Tax=Amylocarpus encephaloides TaxID=45428 RepID=A0A9P7YIE1_9HELO|nr:putative DnaJ like protein subfamily C member 9 [Amylocarpus encephaloides]